MAVPDPPSTIAEGPVDRAFHLLQVVVSSNEPLGVRELGRRTGLPRSTASRLVGTLERLRMVDRTPNGDVIPGGGLATLQIDSSTAPLLKDQLHPLLIDLVQRFGENAALAVDDGDALLYVSNVASENPVSVSDVAGERHSFHLVAPGLVAMSAWPAARLTEHLRSPLTAATEFSMTRSSALRRRLRQVATDGFAWTDQELDVGINGLAVPVIIDGALVATISLYGPSYRFSPDARPTLAGEVQQVVLSRLSSI